MPICPKCGKSLTSDQALTYHLNRKYKCGTWNCMECGKNFNTKFDLKIHEMNCNINSSKHDDERHPSSDVLLEIYNNIDGLIIAVDDKTQIIISASRQGLQIHNLNLQDVVGKKIQELGLHIERFKQICKNIYMY